MVTRDLLPDFYSAQPDNPADSVRDFRSGAYRFDSESILGALVGRSPFDVATLQRSA